MLLYGKKGIRSTCSLGQDEILLYICTYSTHFNRALVNISSSLIAKLNKSGFKSFVNGDPGGDISQMHNQYFLGSPLQHEDSDWFHSSLASNESHEATRRLSGMAQRP